MSPPVKEFVILLQALTKAVVKPVSRGCSPKKWRNLALTRDLGCMADHLLPTFQEQHPQMDLPLVSL